MTIKETLVVTLTGMLVAGLVFLACGALGVLLARQARAEDYRCHYVRQTYPAWDSWQGIVVTRERWVRRCYRNHVYHYPEREPTRVYSYVRRDDEDDRRGGDCRDMRRAVGNQHLTIDGAKKAANDAWAGAIRFHLGEKWMDLGNAKRIVYTCSRSSIKEGDITTLGQTLNRCEIEAVPCRPARDRGNE